MKKIILTLMLAVVSLSSFAQFGGGQFQMPKPEEMATRRADQIKEQVKDAGQLTDEQYKNYQKMQPPHGKRPGKKE